MSTVITVEYLPKKYVLSRSLGIAAGLVNSCLKNLVSKGFVRVKNFPSNRYAYLLTSQGLAEKSWLAHAGKP